MRGRSSLIWTGAQSDYPSTLSLTGWWRDYTGVTWSGTASAGSSGSKSFNGSNGSPTNGSTLNGRTSLRFTNTTDYLSSASNLSDLISTSAYTFWVLFKADANPSGRIVGPSASSSIWDVNLVDSTSDVIRLGHGSESDSGSSVIGTSPHLWMVTYDSAEGVDYRLDSGSASIGSTVDVPAISGTLRLGARDSGSDACNEVDIFEIGFTQSFLDTTAFADFASEMVLYVNNRYGLSL